MSRKLTRAAVLVVLLLSVIAGMRNTPAARAAATPPQSAFNVTFGGTVYHLAAGQSIRFPITFANGSKGFEVFSLSAPSASLTRAPLVIQPPNPIFCNTTSAGLSTTDAFGQELFQYTEYQHWCWDGATITSHSDPTYSW